MELRINVINSAQQNDKRWMFSSENVTKHENTLHFKAGCLDIYLEGEFYYYCIDDDSTIINDNNIKILEQLFCKYSLHEIPCILEGIYCGIAYDTSTKRITLFSDYLNRKNLYYAEEKDCFIASSNLTDILGLQKEIHYDQTSLYSYLLLGYTPVMDTFYSGVKRLGPDQFVVITEKNVTHESYPKVKGIRDYDKSDIDRYETYLTNAVVSRASSSNNTVMLSGGWDSTSLIYLLTKHYDKSNINSIIFDVVLSDKRSFNVYEVDKSKRIADSFGVKLDHCVVDYNDKKNIDLWERNLDLLRDNHVYFGFHHLKLAEQIGSNDINALSVFNGEASDSIHNFGYSQFVSVNYDNMLLREYADKGKSFLFGPTFFAGIERGDFREDKVFQFFTHYYGQDRFDLSTGDNKVDTLKKYVQSFLLSSSRVPFAKWGNSLIAKQSLMHCFIEHTNHTYFLELFENMNNSNLYYYLLQLYRCFHFQSAQIQINNVVLSPYHILCKMPFLDLKMLDFMYSMPENWGRGLELKPTKYPLRYLANERWKGMPLHILEENGPHSYIAEQDKKWTYSGGNWDILCEILYKSVFSDYFKDVFLTVNIEDYFDAHFFEVNNLKAIINDYLNGVEDLPNHTLLFRLALLCSIGLYSKANINKTQNMLDFVSKYNITESVI